MGFLWTFACGSRPGGTAVIGPFLRPLAVLSVLVFASILPLRVFFLCLTCHYQEASLCCVSCVPSPTPHFVGVVVRFCIFFG